MSKARGKLSAAAHPRAVHSRPGNPKAEAARLLMAHAKHVTPSPKKSPRAKP